MTEQEYRHGQALVQHSRHITCCQHNGR